MNNLSAELSKDSNLFKFYYRDDYLDNSKPRLDEKNDSLNFTNTTFEDNIENILKKSNFTDTTNTIFVDNINSMLISGKISKLNLNEVSSSSSMTRGKKEIYHFLTSDLSTTWYLTNMYGDTIFKKYISNRSGEMIANEDNYKVASQNVFKDAIETSFLKFFEDTKVQELLKKETTLNEKYEKIVINKNHQNPKNLDEAMQASFTIKLKEGHGSGFLVSNDGYIITNHHVINKENNIKAVDQNGKEFELKVIRSNKNLDLALCKIEGDFKFAFNLPNEKNFDIGSDIFAVGTPKSIELGQSITKGVVSGYRTNTFNNSKIVQTDAKINRGNSGGAIITNNGNLVGVVDYKIFGVGVEGLSFAIGATEIKTALGIE